MLLLVTGCGGEREGPFFPLAPGWEWQYRVRVQTADGAEELRQQVRTIGPERVDGFPAWTRVRADGSRFYYREDRSGIHRIGSRPPDGGYRPEAEERLVLGRPFRHGTRWRQQELTSLLQRTGPPQETRYRIRVAVPVDYVIVAADEVVEVPAGRFTGCLRVEGEGETSADAGNYVGNIRVRLSSSSWYCPGAGLVREERVERTSNRLIPEGRMVMELQGLHHP
ncbi:MAG: hypothetical protein D6786_07495 [Gammaproteobacteria bacterium]|nr:MAG: hypothetical protein D6786_07495 [Gammaproteobacteria bacterium]